VVLGRGDRSRESYTGKKKGPLLRSPARQGRKEKDKGAVTAYPACVFEILITCAPIRPAESRVGVDTFR